MHIPNDSDAPPSMNPSPDDPGDGQGEKVDVDPEGDGVTLADIADALDQFASQEGHDPEVQQDLMAARDLIEKHANREEEGAGGDTAEEQEDTEAAPPTEGNGDIK